MQTTSQTQVCETTSTNPETATRDPASLLSICTDCRYIILEYLLVSPFPIKPRNGNSSETRVMSPRFTDIALVCQKLKEEAYDIFFRKNQFLFESLPVQDPALLLSSDPAPISKFNIFSSFELVLTLLTCSHLYSNILWSIFFQGKCK